MKKKLLSFAIAFALLSQTMVFAGGLSGLVSGLFGGLPATTSVTTTVTGYVKATTDSAYPATGYNQTNASNFDYKAGIDMSSVRTAFATYYTFGKSHADSNGYGTDFDNSDVTGNFTITFTYPSSITGTAPTVADLNAQFTALGSIFEATNVDTSVANKLVVSAKVKNTTPLKVGTLNTTAATALADFALETTNLTASATSTIEVSMTGDVYITETDDTNFAKISFDSNTSPVTITVNKGTGTGFGDGGNSGSDDNGDVVIDSNNNSSNSEVTVAEGDSTNNLEITNSSSSSHHIIIESKPGERQGFIENGYSLTPYAGGDKDYDGTTVIDVPAGASVSLYPRYVNVTVPSALEPETDENGNYLHKVYIYGYPDSEVKPNNNITREEITAAFDRLLNTIYRQTIVTTEQNFPDVNNDRWSNESIATMANGGFIVGDENGNFNPSKPITRAEFAVIASKFAPADAKPAENYFTDIDGHWAKDFILKVAGQYWISGYGNGTFNPDAYITRAEAMTIINRMLVRYGDEDSDYAKQWPDVDKSDWYYDSVIEATTHNTYVRTENGWSEKWVNDMISGDEE